MAKFLGGHNVFEIGSKLISVRYESLILSKGGDDEVTGIEFLGSNVRVEINSKFGLLNAVQADNLFLQSHFIVGDKVSVKWEEDDQIYIEH